MDPHQEHTRSKSSVKSPPASPSKRRHNFGSTKQLTIIMESQEDTCAAAATKIQAGFRGYKVRKLMKGTKNGPEEKSPKRTVMGRRKSSTKKNEADSNDLEEKSATKIQAGIRGFLVRKKINQKKTQIS